MTHVDTTNTFACIQCNIIIIIHVNSKIFHFRICMYKVFFFNRKNNKSLRIWIKKIDAVES